VRNVSDKICRQDQNPHFMLGNNFFSFENRAFYVIMWGKKYCTAGWAKDDNMAHALLHAG
jgi:hypothetical protein